MANSITLLKETRETSRDEESNIRGHITKSGLKRFQLFYLSNDKSQNVEIEETPQIDFKTVIYHLEKGESVFIKKIGQHRPCLPS